MKGRCLRESHPSYYNYGGRGISICDRWLDFEKFYEDMGDPPEGLSLERIDTDGDYTPENCQWAKWSDQMRNRRDRLLLTVNGVTKPLMQWCEERGIAYHNALQRLKTGFEPEEVLSEQSLKRRDLKYITRNGMTKSLHEWCQLLKMSYATVRARIANYGWGIEEALTTPIRR